MGEAAWAWPQIVKCLDVCKEFVARRRWEWIFHFQLLSRIRNMADGSSRKYAPQGEWFGGGLDVDKCF